VIESSRRRRWDAFDRLLALAALAAGAVLTLRAPGFGDYPTDAGPALSAISHGNLGGFFSHQPAMGAVSLYVRAPFVILAAALHDSPIGIYRWGDFPCVLSVALVAIWLARVAGARGTGRLGQVLILAICLGNPLINNALYFGHPEELLTASFAVGALLAASERKVVLAAVLAGLAVATKQWALLIVCPTLLVLERERIRAALLMLAVAAGTTLPMVIGNFAAFRFALRYIANAQGVTTTLSWLYPISPARIVRLSYIFGGGRDVSAHIVLGIVSELDHPVIIWLGVAIPLLLWLQRGRRLSVEAMLLSTALVFVLRSTLDPETAAYYYVPLLLMLVALDAAAGRRIPVAALAGAAGTFTVLDRFPTYFSIEAAYLLYAVATVVGVALLVRQLLASQPAPAAADPPRLTAWSPAGVGEQRAVGSS